jgi:hypothetical protein
MGGRKDEEITEEQRRVEQDRRRDTKKNFLHCEKI